MKVDLNIRIGIIALTKAAAENFAREARIPRDGWFYAYPATMLGTSNVIFMKVGGWDMRPDAAEIDRLLTGCQIVFEQRVISAMQEAIGARAPVETRALRESIEEVDNWSSSGTPLCCVENPISLGESIMLVLHELKRLRVLASSPSCSGIP